MSISPVFSLSFRRTSCIVRLLAILAIAATPVRAAVGAWSPLGPDGASVYALAVHPKNPRILYAGTETSGVFKSADGGATWRLSSGGLGSRLPYAWVRALVTDPHDPEAVYAATLVDGVFRSEDEGRSWAPASQGLPRAGGGFQAIRALILDPRSPRTLYAGSFGGVFRSTDGGMTWKPRRAGLPRDGWITALALDPSTGTLYAGGGLGHVFHSTDQGKSWTAKGPGLPAFVSIVSLAIDPAEPRRLLAGTTGGLFRSTDSGRSWKQAGRSVIGSQAVNAVVFQSSRLAYAGTSDGVFRSDDGGATWRGAAEMEDPSVLSLAAGRQALYAGTFGKNRRGGVFRSLDHGDTWEPVRRGLSTLTVQEIAFDPSDPELLYASVPNLGLFKSADGGASWSVLDLGLPPGAAIEISSLLIEPAQPATIYAASRVNGPLLRSTDGGESWQLFSNPLLSFEDLAFDPGAPGALWAAGQRGLYHSSDGGATWDRQPLQPEEYFLFYDIQVDPSDPRIMYVSGGALYDDLPLKVRPRIFRSTDGGQTWQRRDAGLPDQDGQIDDFVLDPADSSTLYVNLSGNLYRSTDAGTSWAPLPLHDVTALAAAPSEPPALYAAQYGNGVLRSTDQGETWTPLRRGLGQHPVLVLRPDPQAPERIFAGTTNGGIFTYTVPAGE